ncbi:MAG: hypothetical protein GY749_05430 [Desulfobacteraceae bacterium]|nr:hypothetical protein [Desulfobacteraceae bacterium]
MPAKVKDCERYKILRKNVKVLSNFWAGNSDYSMECGHYELLTDDGWCNGLAYMWGQAVLAKDTSTYYDRLNLLTRKYKINELVQDYQFFTKNIFFNKRLHRKKRKNARSHDPKKIVAKLAKKYEIEISSDQWQNNFDKSYEYIASLFISIRAFLDGLLLYQSPSDTSLYFDNRSRSYNPNLHRQKHHMVANYVANDKMMESCHFDNNNKIKDRQYSPLARLFSESFYQSPKEFGHIIKKLYLHWLQKQVEIFYTIKIIGHTIGFTFEKNKFILYDANFMSRSYDNIPEKYKKIALEAPNPYTRSKRISQKHERSFQVIAINTLVHSLKFGEAFPTFWAFNIEANSTLESNISGFKQLFSNKELQAQSYKPQECHRTATKYCELMIRNNVIKNLSHFIRRSDLNPNMLKDTDGDNLFHFACSYANDEALKALFSDINLFNTGYFNARNKHKNTPFHTICNKVSSMGIYFKLLNMADMFRKCNEINYDLTDRFGDTAIDTLFNQFDNYDDKGIMAKQVIALLMRENGPIIKKIDDYLSWSLIHAKGSRGVTRFSHWGHGKSGRKRAENLKKSITFQMKPVNEIIKRAEIENRKIGDYFNNHNTFRNTSKSVNEVKKLIKKAARDSSSRKHSLRSYLAEIMPKTIERMLRSY